MKTQNNNTRINSDIQLLTELTEVCKAGEKFYSTVASHVENQALRNQLFGMSELRSGIVNSLNHEAADLNSNELAQTAIHLKLWYSKAHIEFPDFENREFLEIAEDKEQQYLSTLRHRISRVRNQRYATLLASKAASMQIMHDQLRQLKETFN